MARPIRGRPRRMSEFDGSSQGENTKGRQDGKARRTFEQHPQDDAGPALPQKGEGSRQTLVTVPNLLPPAALHAAQCSAARQPS